MLASNGRTLAAPKYIYSENLDKIIVLAIFRGCICTPNVASVPLHALLYGGVTRFDSLDMLWFIEQFFSAKLVEMGPR